MMSSTTVALSWWNIVRLGFVQASLGTVVVLTTSTLNRIMVVELALPATLPGALVALHYAVQMLRPRIGHGSDIGGSRTPWIIGGIATLAAGGFLASCATILMGSQLIAGIALGVLAFVLIGLGVGAAGTSLLVLLAKQVAALRRPAAATIVWMMMIFGFALTAGVSGKLLDPYSSERLLWVSGGVSTLAFVAASIAVQGVERSVDAAAEAAPAPRPSFAKAFTEVWAERDARRFTIFVFVSMLAYSAQDLILEAFAGSVYGLTAGQSKSLSGLQHASVLIGMILVAFAGTAFRGRLAASLYGWTVGGCVASAAAMSILAWGALHAQDIPINVIVTALGIANGAFSIAVIGSMMRLASGSGASAPGREAMRMGLWGASQAIAFGLGVFFGTMASDFVRKISGSTAMGYGAVFAIEAVLFVVSAMIAMGVGRPDWTADSGNVPAIGEHQMVSLPQR